MSNVKGMTRLPVFGDPETTKLHAGLGSNFQYGAVAAPERSVCTPSDRRDTVPLTAFDQDTANVRIVLWAYGIGHRLPIVRIGRATGAQIPDDQRTTAHCVRAAPISDDSRIIDLGIGFRRVKHARDIGRQRVVPNATQFIAVQAAI